MDRHEPSPGILDLNRGPVRVFIFSALRLTRESLALALNGELGAVVVGATDDLEAAESANSEVLVIDLAFSDPLALQRLVARATVPALVLGVADHETDVVTWMEAGVAGFVTRDGSLEDLAAALRDVRRGELRCSPRIVFRMGRRLAVQAATGIPQSSLTVRELEILDLIDRGLSNKEIAVRLGLAVSTVKNHVHAILDKLQVTRRGEAVAVVRGRSTVLDPRLDRKQI